MARNNLSASKHLWTCKNESCLHIRLKLRTWNLERSEERMEAISHCLAQHPATGVAAFDWIHPTMENLGQGGVPLHSWRRIYICPKGSACGTNLSFPQLAQHLLVDHNLGPNVFLFSGMEYDLLNALDRLEVDDEAGQPWCQSPDLTSYTITTLWLQPVTPKLLKDIGGIVSAREHWFIKWWEGETCLSVLLPLNE